MKSSRTLVAEGVECMVEELDGRSVVALLNPKGPCAQIVYTLALKYLYRDYIKAKVYTI